MQFKTKHYNIIEADIISGKYEPMDLVEPLWWSVSIYDSHERYEADLAPFTKSQRLVFAVMWYESEVCNGGHDQFFFNSTGIVWKDALEGFELIGAEKCAENLRKVIEKCGGDVPFDRSKRQEMLDKLTYVPEDDDYNDIFRENDSVFYECEDGLEELIMNYAKANAGEFVFSGEVQVPSNFS